MTNKDAALNPYFIGHELYEFAGRKFGIDHTCGHSLAELMDAVIRVVVDPVYSEEFLSEFENEEARAKIRTSLDLERAKWAPKKEAAAEKADIPPHSLGAGFTEPKHVSM